MSQETRRRIIAARRSLTAASSPELRVPDFARGIGQRDVPLTEIHVGRFSEGIESLPEDSPDKVHVGRFSDGIETMPEDTPEKLHVGRFSEGIENAPAPRAGAGDDRRSAGGRAA